MNTTTTTTTAPAAVLMTRALRSASGWIELHAIAGVPLAAAPLVVEGRATHHLGADGFAAIQLTVWIGPAMVVLTLTEDTEITFSTHR